MYRVGIVVLASLLVCGCVADGATTLPLSVDSRAVRLMGATTSVLQKQRIAATSCMYAGYRIGSRTNRQCVTALIARDLQRIRERADRLIREAAHRRGVCIDRETFAVGRCLEI